MLTSTTIRGVGHVWPLWRSGGRFVSHQLFCSGGERGVGGWTHAHYGTPWQVCSGMCTRSMIRNFASSSCNPWQARISHKFSFVAQGVPRSGCHVRFRLACPCVWFCTASLA
jgi:hypothetical protein